MANGRRSLPSTSCSKVDRAESTSKLPASTTPPPRTKHSGSTTQARLAKPKPTHQPTSSIDAPRRRVARSGSGRDVFAADALGVAAGQAHHLAEPAGHRRFSGKDPQPRPGGEALPAAASAARAGRAVRIDDHVTDLAGEAGRTDLHTIADDDPSADPGAERDQDDVVQASSGAQPVLGQHGEVGVVLDDHGPSGQPVTDQGRPVHPVCLGQIRCEAQPAVAVDHAGRANAYGRVRCAVAQVVIELGRDEGDGLGDVVAHDLAAAGRGGGRAPRRRFRRRDRAQGPAPSCPRCRCRRSRRPRRADAARRTHEVDSTRAFSSRMAVAMMRLVARILMNPGMGTRSSASTWYVTSVIPPSPGSKT